MKQLHLATAIAQLAWMASLTVAGLTWLLGASTDTNQSALIVVLACGLLAQRLEFVELKRRLDNPRQVTVYIADASDEQEPS